jgi:hypothetical protein
MWCPPPLALAVAPCTTTCVPESPCPRPLQSVPTHRTLLPPNNHCCFILLCAGHMLEVLPQQLPACQPLNLALPHPAPSSPGPPAPSWGAGHACQELHHLHSCPTLGEPPQQAVVEGPMAPQALVRRRGGCDQPPGDQQLREKLELQQWGATSRAGQWDRGKTLGTPLQTETQCNMGGFTLV